jgi:hypothetical protein
MAMLFLLGVWAFYFLLARKCLRTSATGIKAGQHHPRVEIPDTVPSKWIEACGAENDI